MFHYKAEFLPDEAAPMRSAMIEETPGFFFSCAINLFAMRKLLKLQAKKAATGKPNRTNLGF